MPALYASYAACLTSMDGSTDLFIGWDLTRGGPHPSTRGLFASEISGVVDVQVEARLRQLEGKLGASESAVPRGLPGAQKYEPGRANGNAAMLITPRAYNADADVAVIDTSTKKSKKKRKEREEGEDGIDAGPNGDVTPIENAKKKSKKEKKEKKEKKKKKTEDA